jgi:hypothetical protein
MGIDIWTRVTGVEGETVLLETCAEGCAECYGGAHPLSALPLPILDYIPQDASTCLKLEAEGPLGQSGGRCLWNALTIHDPLSDTPHVIAISHSSPPTATGGEMLAGLIPEPVSAGTCTCASVGLGDDQCCASSDVPPEFWYYPFGDVQVYPGDYVALNITNQAGLQHWFKLFQAEHVPTCDLPERELSWAVVGQL